MKSRSYILSGDACLIQCLHDPVRAGMARASLLSGVTAPFASFPGFGSIPKDFRLHYAINFGSISLLDAVPIYTPAQLDGQLDEVSLVFAVICRSEGHFTPELIAGYAHDIGQGFRI